MVFNWNKDRYPDFEGLMSRYHEDGIKVSFFLLIQEKILSC